MASKKATNGGGSDKIGPDDCPSCGGLFYSALINDDGETKKCLNCDYKASYGKGKDGTSPDAPGTQVVAQT